MSFGLIVSFPVFSLGYYAMVRTSTPQFCAWCHEIEGAYNDWRTSSHAVNDKGFVADCMDCHLPAPHDTFNFFYMKTAHGIKDVVLHFLGAEYDRETQQRKAWNNIKNDQCLKCHRNILYLPYKRGAMLAHRSILFAQAGNEKRCLDCHRPLVHVRKPLYAYDR
jgi:cytochrome c nitrite reductase small subunit